MMRHVIGSINVLIRKNLGYGAVTDWNFSDEERRDCFCNHQFNVKACSIQGIFKTADVLAHDPESLACPASMPIDVQIEEMVRFPIDEEELRRYKESLGTTKPKKPYVFIFGHGLWNDLDVQATLNWLDKVVAETTTFFPRLMLTPNASGKKKPVEWRETQGNEALMNFEESIRVEAARRGVEHLGTWNMSIQSNKFDGVHLDLKGNMVKAMMVLNWLNMLDVSQY
ncbi:hypothetical protein NA57DRAFT_69243 [Rhizodiscina lignyota]|uniref:Uncharacterized protein n=1 Tax=Rhizodiscina lignyota TaxID=1504668 RepID=A0A9P4I1A1_9PEZI|nr:hypothetical protein NA57DRAFT_69243 [Rhizodiscina lignyota]